MGHLIWRSSTI